MVLQRTKDNVNHTRETTVERLHGRKVERTVMATVERTSTATAVTTERMGTASERMGINCHGRCLQKHGTMERERERERDRERERERDCSHSIHPCTLVLITLSSPSMLVCIPHAYSLTRFHPLLQIYATSSLLLTKIKSMPLLITSHSSMLSPAPLSNTCPLLSYYSHHSPILLH